MNYQSLLTSFQELILEDINSIIIFAGVLILFYLFRAIVLYRLRVLSEKTSNQFDDVLVELLKSLGWVFAIMLALVLASLSAGMNVLTFSWAQAIIIIILTYQAVRAVEIIVQASADRVSRRGGSVIAVTALKQILKLIVWSVGLLVILDTFGFDVTSVIAGLGIGGIAIALAVQNILGDVLSSFSLFFDKPFSVGDFIQVGTQSGTVERIGLKTTRLTSMRGEELVIPNKDLTSTVVQNFGKLKRRRVVESFGVAYETKKVKLEAIKDHLPILVEQIEKLDFERVHLKTFGDSALEFEFVYYVNSDNYNEYTQAQHELHMSMKEWFEKEKIEFAYPTQTIFIKK